jgi:D-alanine-D-alanine ligase
MEIAILAGGNSSEHRISVKSSKEIKQWLANLGYKAHIVIVRGKTMQVDEGGAMYDVDLNTFSFVKERKRIHFEYAWNSIHGNPGEDGTMQGYLDMMGIPHNTAGLLPSALTFNKHVAKTYLRQFGILTAESTLVKRNENFSSEEIAETVGLPCFVKPNSGGSSFGTTRVTQADQLRPAINQAFKEDDEVIVESYVKGTEITCGLLKTTKQELIFPLTEIVSKNDFFDYKAKYEGLADEITPARVEEEARKKIQSLASDIYDYTFCKGIVRVDFIIRGNQIYFLELNTVPGMTTESIVPQQIRAMGKEVESILQLVIDDTSTN